MGKQADGSAFVRYGDTVMFVTATSKKEPREDKPFLPLIVDYRENTYAAGKIPGGFFKREGRPSEREILVARLIDRPVRSLFPEGYFYDTQIVGLLLSADLENEPDTLGVIGASAALYFSDIPFTTPIGAVKVGLVDGPLRRQPDRQGARAEPPQPARRRHRGRRHHDRSRGQGSRRGDDPRRHRRGPSSPSAGSSRPRRSSIAKLGIKKRRVHAQAARRGQAGRDRSASIGRRPPRRPSRRRARRPTKPPSRRSRSRSPGRDPRGERGRSAEAKELFDKLEEKIARELDPRRRASGPTAGASTTSGRSRSRSASCPGPTARPSSPAARPRPWPRSPWARSRTPSGSTAWARKPRSGSCSTTTSRPSRSAKSASCAGPGRREIGHGALAEKAILPAIPANDTFPYTIRIVSDILEIERLLLDGHGLRRRPGPDGRRRPADHDRRPASPWAWSRKATATPS